MKSRSKWVIALLILSAICVQGWTVWGQRQGAPSTQWEYTLKFLGNPEQQGTAILNEFGMQGWELVTVSDGRAYFKRQKK